MTLRAPEPLSHNHDLDSFDCGVPSLDDWLRKRARANQAAGATRTFVATDGREIAGYYALAAGAIAPAETPGKFRRNMPDPIPVAVLARLAVAKAWHGKGLGRGLVSDCARRVIAAGDHVGIRGLIVHAISEEARAFYLRLGFRESPINPMTLMVTMAELRGSV